MKKIVFATVAMFMVVGGASATDRLATTNAPSVYSTNHDMHLESSGASNVTRDGNHFVQGKRAKTRDEVRQELREHQERMRTDRSYAEEWQSMYEDS